MELFDRDDQIVAKLASIFMRTSESVQDDIDKIREWLITQKHLPEIMSDRKILSFLIINKCIIERTKEKIDMYYSIRSIIPDMYDNVNPKLPHMKDAMELIYYVPLPKLTTDLYRVVFFKVRNFKLSDQLDPHKVFTTILNLAEIRLEEDLMLKDLFIIDMKGLGLNYISKLTPTFLSKVLMILEKVYSMRVAAMHLVNSPAYFNRIINILKALMKPKLYKKVFVYTDDSIIKNLLDKEVLPKDYGGFGRSLEEQHQILTSKLVEYQTRFDEIDKLRVNENLRPEKLENDDILGFHGNFKKLNVD